jgi:hypothetical protein
LTAQCTQRTVHTGTPMIDQELLSCTFKSKQYNYFSYFYDPGLICLSETCQPDNVLENMFSSSIIMCRFYFKLIIIVTSLPLLLPSWGMLYRARFCKPLKEPIGIDSWAP